VNDVPEPMEVPPDEAVYQLIVPAEGVADNTTVPVPQRLAGVDAVIVGLELIVATTAVLAELPHPAVVA
jgi:hypothetical protein